MAQLRCPRCLQPTAREGNPHRPFCSERCRLIDLEGWFGERYTIPGDPVDPVGDAGESGEGPGPGEPAPRRRTRS